MNNDNFKISENTSLGLDLLRAIAAQMVVIGHGIGFMGIAMWLYPPNFPWVQNVAVVIFFLLSGLVITYSTFRKLKYTQYNFKQFFLERFSRIYSAYIPAILLVVVLDAIHLYYLDGINIWNTYNLRTFVLNLVMLQDYPVFQLHQSVLSAASFGSARPFWTLAVEWWIYMFFGWFILGKRNVGNKFLYYSILIFLSIVPMYNLVEGRGNGLGLVWIFGLAIVLLLNQSVTKNITNKSLLLFIFCIVLAIFREYFVRIAYDAIFALFLGGALYFLIIYLNHTQFKLHDIIKKCIRLWADYSFTLYLLHYSIFTIIALFKNSYSPYLLFFIGVITSNVLSMVLAYFTEMRHKKVRKYLFDIFGVHLDDNIIK